MIQERSKDITRELAAASSLDFHELANSDETYNFRVKQLIISDAGGVPQTISGILAGDPDSQRKTFTLSPNEPHNLAFRKIWRSGTTTNTIIIMGILA